MNKIKILECVLVILLQFICFSEANNYVYAEVSEVDQNITYKNPQNSIEISADLIGGEINGIQICRVSETNLGNLIADSLVDYTRNILEASAYENYHIVAIQNGGGIRQSIKKGVVTKDEIDEALPYNNYVVAYVVTPKLLYEVLENGVSKIYKDNNGFVVGIDGRFPQVSGMRFIYDYSQTSYDKISHSGSRILAVYLDNMTEPLNRYDEKTEIILAFNDFCAAGGDGYDMLKNIDALFVGDTINDIFWGFIKELTNSGDVINYSADSRIEFGQSMSDSQKDIRVFFNSQLLDFDTVPFIENNKVFVPLRKIVEQLGAQVLWNEEKQLVTINSEDRIIEAFINQKHIKINEEYVNLDESIKIINNRTMVPISFFGTAFNVNVDWDCKYNALFINS